MLAMQPTKTSCHEIECEHTGEAPGINRKAWGSEILGIVLNSYQPLLDIQLIY